MKTFQCQRWNRGILILSVPRNVSAHPSEDATGFDQRVGLGSYYGIDLGANLRMKNDVRWTFAQISLLPIHGKSLGLGFDQVGIISEGVVFKDFLKHQRLAGIDHTFFQVERSLERAAGKIASDDFGRDHGWAWRSADQSDVTLLPIHLGKGQPNTNKRSGLDGGMVVPNRQRVRDPVFYRHDLQGRTTFGSGNDLCQMVGQFPL